MISLLTSSGEGTPYPCPPASVAPKGGGTSERKVERLAGAYRITRGIPNPSRVEFVALEEAARYLRRAGTQTATLLLLANPSDPDGAMLELLRDEFLTGAALCESVIDVAKDQSAIG